MVKARVGAGVLAGLLLAGGGAAWAVAPTPAQVLNFKPKQDGLSLSTPKAEEEGSCKVEAVKGAGRASGWLLKDAAGQPLRRFFDTNGDNKVDLWSYFKDGVEVYRETDSNFNGKPDQYRWLNTAGMKWGVDDNEDGKIDRWQAISPEEVGEEAFKALATRDFARYRALVVNEADLKAIELPADALKAIREEASKAQAKFADALGKLTALNEKSNYLHIELGSPQCTPADQTGGRADVLRHSKGSVLFASGDKTDWIQTGEMVLVGGAWRLVGGPSTGVQAVDKSGSGPGVAGLDDNPELKKLIEALTKIDDEVKAIPQTGGPNPALVKHHLKRADHLEKIVGKVKPEERDPWIRQVADSLSTAAQSADAKDTTPYQRLMSLEEQLVKAMPGSNLTAYVTFREMQAAYAAAIQDPKAEFNKVQQGWVDRLTKFVQTYPKGEDTPDALLQLGMVSEFLNKDTESKNWYSQLVKNFPDKTQAVKAAGAGKRLELEGQLIKLAGPTLADSNVVYDADQARGKVVIVYYWASWNGQSVGDFAKLKLLLDQYESKGVALVGVNLDNTAAEAQEFLKKSPAPGTHLHQAGGLEGKLATDYGIMVLPQLFLVGKDGKVLNRNLQIANMEEEVKKALK